MAANHSPKASNTLVSSSSLAEQVLNLSIAAEMLTRTSEDYNRSVEGFQRDRKFHQDWQGR